jgi:hypothetical protein
MHNSAFKIQNYFISSHCSAVRHPQTVRDPLRGQKGANHFKLADSGQEDAAPPDSVQPLE